MVKFIQCIALLLTVGIQCLSAYAHNIDLDEVVSYIQSGNIEKARESLVRYGSDLPDSIKGDYYYLSGAIEDSSGNLQHAIMCFEKYLKYAECKNAIDSSYIDALARCANYSLQAEDWKNVVRLSSKALGCPEYLLESYPYTYLFYDWQAHALNFLWKYKEVVSLTDKGIPLYERWFSPKEKTYYNMLFSQAIALLMMNKWNDAEKIVNRIDSINIHEGDRIVDYEVNDLRNHLQNYKALVDWRGNAAAVIEEIRNVAERLLLKSVDSNSTQKAWMEFFNNIQNQLELYYFDINDYNDERYWSRLLGCAIVYFNIIHDRIPYHSELAYNLILLRKNFLDYHSGQLHKTPIRWEEIRAELSDGELAIEITMCPDEILVIGKDYPRPVTIAIPDDIVTNIGKYNKEDAAIVNEFYSEGSPMSQLINLLAPYLEDTRTIYLSTANLFAQFNYGAVPFQEGVFDDYYDIIQLTTTADIDNYRKNERIGLNGTPILYGGIDYDNTPEYIASAPEIRSDYIGKLVSTIRSGFGYLPHTLREIEAIAEILPESRIYTGQSANEQQFKSTDWSKKPTILHIATHGYSVNESDNDLQSDSISGIAALRLKSGLLLAGANRAIKGDLTNKEDGILTSREIADLDMSNVNLAVLSSCSSGMGDLTNTTGIVYGVADALKSAGVKHMVVTLWDIPDEASSIAMEKFYHNIVSGATVRDSIKGMRQYMIEKGFTDPYYWAAFEALD